MHFINRQRRYGVAMTLLCKGNNALYRAYSGIFISSNSLWRDYYLSINFIESTKRMCDMLEELVLNKFSNFILTFVA